MTTRRVPAGDAQPNRRGEQSLMGLFLRAVGGLLGQIEPVPVGVAKKAISPGRLGAGPVKVTPRVFSEETTWSIGLIDRQADTNRASCTGRRGVRTGRV